MTAPNAASSELTQNKRFSTYSRITIPVQSPHTGQRPPFLDHQYTPVLRSSVLKADPPLTMHPKAILAAVAAFTASTALAYDLDIVRPSPPNNMTQFVASDCDPTWCMPTADWGPLKGAKFTVYILPGLNYSLM